MPEKRGEFCFLKHYCQHCGQEISLDPKRLCQYEKRGYPKYIQGHQHWGSNNVMSRPEIRAKITAYKIEDAKKPKEPTPKLNLFGKIICVKEGKYIKCKKPKAFCSQWEFCHKSKSKLSSPSGQAEATFSQYSAFS